MQVTYLNSVTCVPKRDMLLLKSKQSQFCHVFNYSFHVLNYDYPVLSRQMAWSSEGLTKRSIGTVTQLCDCSCVRQRCISRSAWALWRFGETPWNVRLCHRGTGNLWDRNFFYKTRREHAKLRKFYPLTLLLPTTGNKTVIIQFQHRNASV